MRHLNREVLTALALLVGCGVFFVESLRIEETSYASLQAYVWPQIVIGLLTVFCLALLAQALRSVPAETERTGLRGWLTRYRNALTCYVLFFLFLITLPYLGMLRGGMLFVFATLSALGLPTLSLVPLHAAIAVISVGAMWAVFTFALRVFLPEGEILRIW